MAASRSSGALTVLPRTVVLIGDTGMGKSRIVEKVTGITGISSAADESFTSCSHVYETRCRRLHLIDTPGGNAMREKLEHNVWIAAALNYEPVSLIPLVVKAEPRIDSTVASVRYYAERFQDFSDLLCVCVTHMDLVSWPQDRLLNCLHGELGLGFDTAIFVGNDVDGETIVGSILRHLKAPQDLSITSENFLKYFNISNNNMRILRSVRNEVAKFRLMKQKFDEILPEQTMQDQVDLCFQFQAYMTQEICEAQKRVAEENSFTFMGDKATVANEAGHIANMTSQLRAVLFDVRTLAIRYQSDAGVSDVRRCPHCGEVWAKIDGCDGETTCGNRTNIRESRFDTLGTFAFRYDRGVLNISRVNVRRAVPAPSLRTYRGRGCGRVITWSLMAPVPVPHEFRVTPSASTDDVDMIPAGNKHTFGEMYSEVESALGPIKKSRA